MNRLLLAITALLLSITSLAALTGCNNECGFHEYCDGNTRIVCGDGPDQVFNREINEFPCEGANSACVEISERYTRCVQEPATLCDDNFTGTCEDNVRTYCPPSIFSSEVDIPNRYVSAEDCSESQRQCGDTESGASCLADGS